MRRTEMYSPIYVINDDKMIYKVASFEQLGANEHCFSYNLELVAGHDYINPDHSDAQGFVSKEGFTESVQDDYLTVYPMHESLAERLADEGYSVINIDDYKIHEFKISS
jgi:isopentenyldiphosphate isomerase